MNLVKGRPEISADDHPVTVYAALLDSIAFYNREMPEVVADVWVKTAQDAYEAVQDGFGIIDAASEPLRPEGSALLLMTLDQLELALVYYGCLAIDNAHTDKVASVDSLLKSIDAVRV